MSRAVNKPRTVRVATRNRTADLAGLKKGLAYVAAALGTLAGDDDKESRLVRQMKQDLGEATGETVQDFLLLLEGITDALQEDLGDGTVTGAEFTSSIFGVLGEVGEIIADIDEATR